MLARIVLGETTFWQCEYWLFRKNYLYMARHAEIIISRLNIGDIIRKSPITKVSSLILIMKLNFDISSYTVCMSDVHACLYKFFSIFLYAWAVNKFQIS